jgi:hypothetical protein
MIPTALDKLITDLKCMGFKVKLFDNNEEYYIENGIIFMNFIRDNESVHIEYDY